MNLQVLVGPRRLQLNCPVCHLRLDYLRWDDGTWVYRCQRHGPILLLPNGLVHPDHPDRPLVFH